MRILSSRDGRGFKLLGKASQPTRKGSSGIDPPPAKESATNGDCSPYAAFTRPRAHARYVGFAELSQLEKPAMNLKSAFCNSLSVRVEPIIGTGRSRCRACSLNFAGQRWSQGSGSKRAITIARQAASGRRAHQRCKVEGCPCRM